MTIRTVALAALICVVPALMALVLWHGHHADCLPPVTIANFKIFGC